MAWLDEGALFSQIGAYLSEDLGRGDITTQAVVARNARARGRFVAKEPMIVAGIEAAETVFSTLDSQQQIEAFVSDGEEVEEGKVIARTNGFADVLLAGERLALNLMQRLSGVATLTRAFVQAVEGTKAQIVDTRKTTPGLRMLEKYAVLSGGGRNHRLGLDDGVLIKDNHIALAGGVKTAVERAPKWPAIFTRSR
ncbi:MAG: carboxylating nicotinate-nucleotide diphosphorylase [Pyrinomonadaceae bacterium]